MTVSTLKGALWALALSVAALPSWAATITPYTVYFTFNMSKTDYDPLKVDMTTVGATASATLQADGSVRMIIDAPGGILHLAWDGQHLPGYLDDFPIEEMTPQSFNRPSGMTYFNRLWLTGALWDPGITETPLIHVEYTMRTSPSDPRHYNSIFDAIGPAAAPQWLWLKDYSGTEWMAIVPQATPYVAPSAVPLPAGAPLLLAALGALGLMRRKKG